MEVRDTRLRSSLLKNVYLSQVKASSFSILVAYIAKGCLQFFSGARLMYHGCTSTWRFHTGLCKFLRNISTNMWSLGKRRGLKLVCFLVIFYNITNSYRFPLDGFRWFAVFTVTQCVTVKTIYAEVLPSTLNLNTSLLSKSYVKVISFPKHWVLSSKILNLCVRSVESLYREACS